MPQATPEIAPVPNQAFHPLNEPETLVPFVNWRFFMTKHGEVTTVETIGPGVLKRVSWPAIFAGVAVVLVTQLLLAILGVGIGAATFEPVSESDPAAGLGIGTGIWLIVSTIIALFAGGCVAGRLGGSARRADNMLHGVLTWSVATLVTFYLITTAMGSIIGGATGMLGRGLAMAGQSMGAVATEVGQAVGGSTNLNLNVNVSEIQQEARQLLRQAGQSELAEQDLTTILNRIATQGAFTTIDRDALINVLVQRTNMSRPEAEQTVTRWQQRFDQLKTQVAQSAERIGSATASGLSKAALWTFFVFVLGGGAAAAGGSLGGRRNKAVTTETHPVNRV
jgi:hypothetical protein